MSRFSVVSLGALALAFASCSLNGECGLSSDCPSGQVCMRIEPMPGDVSFLCAQQCGATFPPCGQGRCFCPDSPAGARCKVTDAPAPTLPDGGVSGVFYCGGP
jgi:hypothetical protein